MPALKRAIEILSWVFFAAGIAWIFFGPTLLPNPDCDPRALLGCGLLDIGLGGATATMVNGVGKFVVAGLLCCVWALLQRAALGRWPRWPFDPK